MPTSSAPDSERPLRNHGNKGRMPRCSSALGEKRPDKTQLGEACCKCLIPAKYILLLPTIYMSFNHLFQKLDAVKSVHCLKQGKGNPKQLDSVSHTTSRNDSTAPGELWSSHTSATIGTLPRARRRRAFGGAAPRDVAVCSATAVCGLRRCGGSRLADLMGVGCSSSGGHGPQERKEG